MKKKKYFCILLVIAQVWMLVQCSDDDDWQDAENGIPEGAVSVEEAKAFFEEQMMMLGEAGITEELHGFATNFTPLWNDAVLSGKDSMVSVDIPIIADYQFKAIVLANDTSKIEKYTQDMPQKLIVVKDLRTGNMGTYVVSIIPDMDYALEKGKVNAMDFPNYGDYGNFSGKIVYSFPLSPMPMRINHYKYGALINEANFFDSSDNPTELQVIGSKMAAIMEGVWLKRKSRLTLRTYEIDGGWLDEVVISDSGGGGGGGGSSGINSVWWDYWNNRDNNGNSSADPNASGGGSSSTTTAVSISAKLKAIAAKISLNAAATKKLSDAFEAMLKECGYDWMYVHANYIYNIEFSDIRINSSLSASAEFNPTTKVLEFKNGNSAIDRFPEEFVHFYQNGCYKGIGKYTSAASSGKANIEFEAKLIQDIICYSSDNTCPQFGAGTNYSTYYVRWIRNITKGGTHFPSYSELLIPYNDCNNLSYWDFLKDSAKAHGLAASVKLNLMPSAISNITGKCP